MRKKQLKTIHLYQFTNESESFGRSPKKDNSLKSNKITNRHSFKTNGKYNQEYQRIQQNDRIIRRIIHPKRDKTILRSIQGIKLFHDNYQTSQRARTQHQNRNKSFRFTKMSQKNYNKNQYEQKYQIKLQNQRMGQRIINVKSSVRTLQTAGTAYRQKLNTSARINKGVVVFFNKQSEAKQNEQFCTICPFKKYYGFGPTILCINKIKINLNPQLKKSDLICIQLMVNNVNPKIYTTSVFPYQILQQTQIKFALRLKKIGQFIPLKIWKIHGVQNIQIGIVDIQCMRYLNQQKSFLDNSQQKQNENKSIQINEKGKSRIIFKDHIQCKLRKSKKQQIQGSIYIQYMLYRKKYL